jgi:transcription-repair coupling factor (superfamily II helicase)
LKNNIFDIQSIFDSDSKFSLLKKDINTNIHKVLNIGGIPDQLIYFFAKMMDSLLENFSFSYSNKNSNFDFFEINKNTKFNELIKILDSLEFYERIEIIDSNMQFAILGDKIDISFNNIIYRLIFLGNDLEDISIRDFLTFKNILSIDNIYLYKNRDIYLSSFTKPVSSTSIYFTQNIDYLDIEFDYTLFPNYYLSINNLSQFIPKEIENIIISTSKGEIDENYFRDKNILYTDIDLPCGFYSLSSKFAILTDVELYGEFNLNLYRSKKSKRIVTDFIDGKIYEGDYIVHINHGIGIFKGVIARRVGNDMKDFLEVEYANNDRLYIPLEISDRITKYMSSFSKKPKLTRLGTSEWSNIKTKVSKDIEDIAREIILTHAQRNIAKRVFMYNSNNLEDEFNSYFEHIETPDQLSAIDDVRKDMYSEKIMDRLIVGDVGFGKTEVAARASFISVINNKQVLILAPTTILVEQHYNVFKKRFAKFPINISMLSRNTTKTEEKNIYNKIKNGELDIIIATHKAFSKKLEFKDLGLIIVDEEQRFGVKQKEALKKSKVDVDYLSMTATPIPRTLYSAFTGIKDISIISTPPVGRKSIKTEIIEFNIDKFIDIVKNEISRGGQVFFLHNNISTLYNIKSLFNTHYPEIKIGVAYGAMSNLSSILSSFKNKEFDMLISTSIIENGIDFPNVNTIIINQAFKFGLAQLYQFRGRVGRSDTNSFCYLVTQNKILEHSKVVRDRLYTLVKNQSVGSGFNISIKDLEIRGAGDLVGVNQHGNIYRVGFDLYSQLLQKVIDDIKVNNIYKY